MMTIDKQNCNCNCLTTQISKGTEWSVLSPEEIRVFNENVICRNYEVHDTVFCEGDECRGVYLVQSGLIGVRKIDLEGEQVLIRLAHPGDTLGYRPFLAGENHRASAEVIRPARVCFLPKAIMKRLLHNNPSLGLGFLQRTARALGAAEERFFETVTLSARVRLFHLLMVLRERNGRIAANGHLHLDLQLTRRDIASMLGIRAESLSRLVRSIEADGLAKFSGNRITITDPDLLLKELDAGLNAQ